MYIHYHNNCYSIFAINPIKILHNFCVISKFYNKTNLTTKSNIIFYTKVYKINHLDCMILTKKIKLEVIIPLRKKNKINPQPLLR